MDNKRMVIAMVVSMAVFGIWLWVQSLIFKAHPEWRTRPEETKNQTQSGPSTQSSSLPTTGATPTTSASNGLRLVGGEAGVTTIGFTKLDKSGQEKQTDRPVAISADAKGASVRRVILNQFRQFVGKEDPYVFQEPYANLDLTAARPLATQYISINGTAVNVGGLDWKKTGESETSVTYAVDVIPLGKEK